MPRRSPLSCFLILGLLAVFAFLAFMAGTSLIARAEQSFGPPAASLNAFQRARLGIELGWRAEALLRPIDPAASPQGFAIGLGEPTGEILQRMQSAGLIREAALFSKYLVYTGLDTQLQAGNFELSAAMNAPQISAALLDPTPGTVTLVILPGWRLEEIAASLPAAGVSVNAEDFLLAAWDAPDGVILPAGVPADSSLEGYFPPGSYEIAREGDVVDLLNTLLLNFDAQVSELRAAFEQQNLTLHEALTVASIVERESVIDEEMPLIASVFLNRIAVGMRLEADPTVQYAVGYDPARGGWWPNPISSADLQIASPYNTYQAPGFPPGPIAAPSLAALQAVAFPQASSYYFFQAACDGSGAHVFALTYDEHLTNNCN
jgi:UPF0755 protein